MRRKEKIRERKLQVFEAHGVDFTGESGDERIGTCPFTGKANKFYVNRKTGLWDAKAAGLSGNTTKFLSLMAEFYHEALTPERLQALADDRQLPVTAFKSFLIGWDAGTKSYTLPVRDPRGRVEDIRRWKPGGRMLSTAGCAVGLLGAHLLDKQAGDPVYLCEGEWDGIAMTLLLAKAKQPGVVLAVPGAGTFKQEWVPWVTGRRIHTLYDHDEAGESGELTIQKRLPGSDHLTFVHWPEELPTGFDTRDWIVYGLKKGTPALSYERLHKLFRPFPRKDESHLKPADEIQQQVDSLIIKRRRRNEVVNAVTLEMVHAMFRKWLFIRDTDAIDIALAIVFSQKIDGSPVWLFLVGPPGSMKTVLLTSLSSYEKAFVTSSVTTHALISGAKGAPDPSLIPRLDGRIFVIKDFTPILGMRDIERNEIFGILRDAYDGKCGRSFGTGESKYFESRFTIIAAVTPAIYDLDLNNASLGERFLKYSVADNLLHGDDVQIIDRAMTNIDRETEQADELANTVTDFLMSNFDTVPIATQSPEMQQQMVYLAKWGARMRGVVSVDSYDRSFIRGRPSAEIGSRLGIQLSKLGRALAMVHGRTEVNDDDYRLVRRVMCDTVHQQREELLRGLFALCPNAGMTASTLDLATRCRNYNPMTVQRVADTLASLDIFIREGTGFKRRWGISTYMRNCIEQAHLYETEADRRPPGEAPYTTLRRTRDGDDV